MPRAYRKRDPDGHPARLLEAVGKLLREKGHHALSIQQITRTAGVGKQYLKSLFGGRLQLIRTYLHQHDFWLPKLKAVQEEPALKGEEVLRLFISMQQEQFRYFLKNPELRKFMLWQMTDPDPLMRTINETREQKGELVISLAREHFHDTGIDVHWVMGIILSSGYFYGLHADSGNGAVCGRDVRNERDVESAVRTFGQVLELFWWAAEQNKRGTLDPAFFRFTAFAAP